MTTERMKDTSKYARGFFGAGGFAKFLAIVVAFFVFLGWLFDKGAPAQPPPSAPPPPSIAWDRSGLELCTPKMLELYKNNGNSVSQRMTTKDFGFPRDNLLSRARCWLWNDFCDVTWKSYDVFLCTEKGDAIGAYEYIENSLQDDDFVPAAGQTLFDDANPRFNCHGYSFASSEFWLNDPEPLLCSSAATTQCARALYQSVDAPLNPRIGDVAVYRDVGGLPVHSGIVSQIINITVGGRTLPSHMIKYKDGFGPRVMEKPEGPGEGTAWEDAQATVHYYRRI